MSIYGQPSKLRHVAIKYVTKIMQERDRVAKITLKTFFLTDIEFSDFDFKIIFYRIFFNRNSSFMCLFKNIAGLQLLLHRIE